MKKCNLIKISVLALLMHIGSMSIMADSTEISKAFAKGDMTKIGSYMGGNVDLTIQNSTNSCDKNRARVLLEDFFRRNRPSNFMLTTKTEKGKSAMMFGKLYTNNGEYTLLILTQKDNNKEQIQQIKISSNK